MTANHIEIPSVVCKWFWSALYWSWSWWPISSRIRWLAPYLLPQQYGINQSWSPWTIRRLRDRSWIPRKYSFLVLWNSLIRHHRMVVALSAFPRKEPTYPAFIIMSITLIPISNLCKPSGMSNFRSVCTITAYTRIYIAYYALRLRTTLAPATRNSGRKGT
jgi:hypothetical protein